ncbi:MAG: signal peptidase I [Clostridia bacterium]|nr:signal peptidase I [Clostridia bacterium]
MKIRNILFNILAIVTVIAVVFVGFNLISGAKGYAVSSPSMKDTLNVGDIVFVKPVAFEELQVGDVVTVASSDGKSFFTHRVVEINENDRTVTTRGDANGADDPMPTEADRIVGRMWYSVPLLGYLTMVLNFSMSRDIWLIVDVLIAVVLILINTVLPKILKKKKRGDSDE